MRSNSLTYSGKPPSCIAMGCEPLGGIDWGDVDIPLIRKAVAQAWDLGITTFDTADAYGLGAGEEELSKALGSNRHDAFIITKFGVAWEVDPNGGRARTFRDASPSYMRQALEASLRRLRVDVIPLYLVHWPDPGTKLDDTLEALEVARQEGKILNYGLSNFDKNSILSAAQSHSIGAVEAAYDLLGKHSQRPVFEAAKTKNLHCFSYGPLAQGLLTGKYKQSHAFKSTDRRTRLVQFQPDNWARNDKVLNLLQETSSKYNKSITQCALRWILDDGLIDTIIIGAKNPDQVISNFDILTWKMEAEDVEMLSQSELTKVAS